MLRQTPQGWKVFDLVIEGISYVRNYRQSFADEIEREGRGDPSKGIEAVIARLEAGTFQAPEHRARPDHQAGRQVSQPTLASIPVPGASRSPASWASTP